MEVSDETYLWAKGEHGFRGCTIVDVGQDEWFSRHMERGEVFCELVLLGRHGVGIEMWNRRPTFTLLYHSR